MFTDSNEDGNVILTIKKPQDKVQAEETELINALQSMLARPNIFLKVAATKQSKEGQSMVVVYAEDRTTLRRIPATDLASALVQPMLKPRLESLGVVNVQAKIKPSPNQLRQYLDNPPHGEYYY